MPQLMPLMWVCSSFMMILVVVVMINIYYYKENYSMDLLNKNFMEQKVVFKW